MQIVFSKAVASMGHCIAIEGVPVRVDALAAPAVNVILLFWWDRDSQLFLILDVIAHGPQLDEDILGRVRDIGPAPLVGKESC